MAPLRYVLIPFRLLLGTVRLSVVGGYKVARTGVTTGARTARASARVGYAAGRAAGARNVALLGTGFALGVLVASPRARAAVGRAGSACWTACARRRSAEDLAAPAGSGAPGVDDGPEDTHADRSGNGTAPQASSGLTTGTT